MYRLGVANKNTGYDQFGFASFYLGDEAELPPMRTDISVPAAPETTKETPVGPDVTGPAAFGLCTAWDHAKTSGNAAEKSIAFRNLAAKGGDAAGIDAYCATVAKPGADGTDSDTAGKPSPLPGAGTTGTSHRP